MAFYCTSWGVVLIMQIFSGKNSRGIWKNLFEYFLFFNLLSINFNKTATRLCVSSDHGTIHVFILDVPEKNSRSTLANASFLPKYFQSKWSCFKFEVNNSSKCICAFSQNSDQHSIIAICADGTYYKYSMDNLANGKNCQLDSCTKFLELSSRQW